MPLTKEELLAIEAKAHEHRRTIIETTLCAGSGHIGGALSNDRCHNIALQPIHANRP